MRGLLLFSVTAVLLVFASSAEAFPARMSTCSKELALGKLYPVQSGHFTPPQLASYLHELRQVYRLVSSARTAYDELEFCRSLDPLTSHCGAVAYSLREILGGQLRAGSIAGHRGIFNELPLADGSTWKVDLSRGQYPGLSYASFDADGFQRVRKFETAGNQKMRDFHERAGRLLMEVIPEWRMTMRQLADNDFPVDRGIFKKGSRDRKSYSDFFGQEFVDRLQSLEPPQAWLDVGSGELFAAVEFFEHSNARHVSINARSPTSAAFFKNQETLRDEKKWTLFEDRIFEDIGDEELGKFHVITDVYSALSYTLNFDLVLRRYLHLLKQGGELYIVLRDGSTLIEDLDGHSISFEDFLHQIGGIQVVKIGEHSYRIIRKRSKLKMPKLDLLQYLARNEERKRWVPVRKLKISETF